MLLPVGGLAPQEFLSDDRRLQSLCHFAGGQVEAGPEQLTERLSAEEKEFVTRAAPAALINPVCCCEKSGGRANNVSSSRRWASATGWCNGMLQRRTWGM
jgi:hypothetical protein